MTGKQIARAIMANVDRWQSREITFETFDRVQKELWSRCDDRPRLHYNVRRMGDDRAPTSDGGYAEDCHYDVGAQAALETLRWIGEQKVVHIARTSDGRSIIHACTPDGELIHGEGNDIISACANARARQKIAEDRS